MKSQEFKPIGFCWHCGLDGEIDSQCRACNCTIRKADFTDLYISPEAMEDIRKWNVDEIDEQTRKEIMYNGPPTPIEVKVDGISIHVSEDLLPDQYIVANQPTTFEFTIDPPMCSHTGVVFDKLCGYH